MAKGNMISKLDDGSELSGWAQYIINKPVRTDQKVEDYIRIIKI